MIISLLVLILLACLGRVSGLASGFVERKPQDDFCAIIMTVCL